MPIVGTSRCMAPGDITALEWKVLTDWLGLGHLSRYNAG
jgi:hypothetical protein